MAPARCHCEIGGGNRVGSSISEQDHQERVVQVRAWLNFSIAIIAELSYNKWRIIKLEVFLVIIKSSTSLRNDYGKISALAHETGEPIYITKNGEGDIVVMSIEAFEKHVQLMMLKSRLLMSEQSLMNGEPTISLAAARERLEAKYNG